MGWGSRDSVIGGGLGGMMIRVGEWWSEVAAVAVVDSNCNSRLLTLKDLSHPHASRPSSESPHVAEDHESSDISSPLLLNFALCLQQPLL